ISCATASPSTTLPAPEADQREPEEDETERSYRVSAGGATAAAHHRRGRGAHVVRRWCSDGRSAVRDLDLEVDRRTEPGDSLLDQLEGLAQLLLGVRCQD